MIAMLLMTGVLTICMLAMLMWIFVLYGKYWDLIKKENAEKGYGDLPYGPDEQIFGPASWSGFGRWFPRTIVDISIHDSTNKLIRKHNTIVRVYRISIILLFPLIIFIDFLN